MCDDEGARYLSKDQPLNSKVRCSHHLSWAVVGLFQLIEMIVAGAQVERLGVVRGGSVDH